MNKRKNIAIVRDGRKTDLLSTDEIYTPKSAYEELILNKPDYITIQDLNSYNLNLFLVDNLRYDSITSQNVKEDMVKNLSLTSGMVQTGEKIIDRGEIVSPGAYSILNSMKIETQRRNTAFKESGYVIIGELIIVIGLIMLLALYLYLFRLNLFENLNHLIFIALMILFIVSISSLVLKFTSLGIYIVPFTMLPIIIRVFFDSRTALFAHFITILIVSFMVDNPFTFIVLQIMAGMTAVSGLKDLTARSQLTQTAFYIFISYSVVYLATELVSEGAINRIYFLPIVYFAISSALLLLAYVLIYIFEKIFNLISAITLVGLTNINLPYIVYR